MEVTSVLREIKANAVDILQLQEKLVGPGEPSFVLEQAEHSYLFFRPYQTLTIRNGVLRIGAREIPGNPLQALKTYLEQFQIAVPGLPPHAAGAVGYLGYDCVQYLETLSLPPGESAEDEACFFLFRQAILFDRARGSVFLVVNLFTGEEQAQAALAEMQNALGTQVTVQPPSVGTGELASHRLDEVAFARAVKTVKGHIRQGDIFQCVLSERMEFSLPVTPRQIYKALRTVSPAPYLYYFEGGGQMLLGASPEPLIKVRQRLAETCPIAGTRPRGATPEEDLRRERQLQRSPKERAEHLMLVDLSRNDLGRVCRPGTVRVRELMQVRRFSHVMHLVSTVEGDLAADQTALSALFAAFPAGTLTGAPKIRAMEIISQLEACRRGAYGGAVVLYDFSGDLDSCITIRSLVAKAGRGVVQAGAGLVADSVASRELAEIHHKSRAMRRALAAGAEGGA